MALGNMRVPAVTASRIISRRDVGTALRGDVPTWDALRLLGALKTLKTPKTPDGRGCGGGDVWEGGERPARGAA